jgi:hypothetical protein
MIMAPISKPLGFSIALLNSPHAVVKSVKAAHKPAGLDCEVHVDFRVEIDMDFAVDVSADALIRDAASYIVAALNSPSAIVTSIEAKPPTWPPTGFVLGNDPKIPGGMNSPLRPRPRVVLKLTHVPVGPGQNEPLPLTVEAHIERIDRAA